MTFNHDQIFIVPSLCVVIITTGGVLSLLPTCWSTILAAPPTELLPPLFTLLCSGGLPGPNPSFLSSPSVIDDAEYGLSSSNAMSFTALGRALTGHVVSFLVALILITPSPSSVVNSNFLSFADFSSMYFLRNSLVISSAYWALIFLVLFSSSVFSFNL